MITRTARTVIVDTCMWIEFFNRPYSPVKKAIERLLRRNQVVMLGPVAMEVLTGFRRREHADWIASLLVGIPLMPLEWDEWREAAELARVVAARGHRLPMTDLVIAAVAMKHDYDVYSTDPHFDSLPDLGRYSPDKP
jgi:predicted nucleic acid-binding protein